MNTQGFTSIEQGDSAQAIAVAAAKVSVLREEEIKLTHSKSELEKDLARLELRKEEIISDIEKLNLSKENIEKQFSLMELKLEKIRIEYGELDAENVIAQKALADAKQNTIDESLKLSKIVVQSRDVENDIAAKLDALRASESSFNERKEKIQSLLSTL